MDKVSLNKLGKNTNVQKFCEADILFSKIWCLNCLKYTGPRTTWVEGLCVCMCKEKL